MKTYKEYEYIHSPEDHSTEPNSMRYIVDIDNNVVYYNMNGGGWLPGGRTKLMPGEDNTLTFIRKLTKKQVEKEVFVDTL